MHELAGIYVLFVLFLLVVGVLWIIMPFAIFGTKPILREILAESKRTNELLEKLATQPRPPLPPG
jgi:hypothetical protein